MSIPEARYFVTFVTASRAPWLKHAPAATAMLDVLRTWHAEADGAILCASVMPDHVHVLFRLGRKLDVGQCVARWKSQVRGHVQYAHDWQRDFFERRLRPDDSVDDYGLYVFLNPYRAKLAEADSLWPFWWAPDPSVFPFMQLVAPGGTPPVEWIGLPDDRFARLFTGE